MTDKREDAAAMALKLRTHCFAGGRLCADRVVGKCRNCTAADMIDALRAELTAARTVEGGEVAHALVCLDTIRNGSHFGQAFSADELIGIITRLSAAKEEAERERDSARADALEDAAKEVDSFKPSVDAQLAKRVCAYLDSIAQSIRSLKPTPTPDRRTMTTSTKCEHCGLIHETTCQRIKAIEYHQDGAVKRIEFHEPQPTLVPFHPSQMLVGGRDALTATGRE